MTGVVAAQRRAEQRRATTATTGVLLAVVAMFLLTLSYGEFRVSLVDVVKSLSGSGLPAVDYIVHTIRLPRALTALLVGLAFGLSGAIFQRLVRNPLASPDVIGVSAGASTAAVTAIIVFGAGGVFVSVAALTGALLTATAIYLLSWRSGVGGYRLVLVGIGIGAGLSSITSFLMTRADVRVAQEALFWLTGSVNGRTWGHVQPLAAELLFLVPAAMILGRALNGLQLGDDLARGLGWRVETTRLALLVTGVLLAGAATAAAGPVAFVAFVAGPIAARLVGGGRPALPASALVGALVVLVADFIGAHLLGATQFPAGVLTALVGAPYLLWLLASANRGGKA
ncbi:FecCD family ABC transporter permease [Actinoplanes couchii]|uniref:Iron ABC transporter permease n=1 Tax=Actinoplanes couchii TaxID=403638 RepID=A0ABQ3X838_9ACTN|nr:iron chelate uptake ABC transporter family permease subunit [Actinoplanes couchii]MDR6320400.1 iron complex transport system permease protein [Actinoplanes couchii]GID54588.1 iron ABC transporter permease [Actinoplanes couchii]